MQRLGDSKGADLLERVFEGRVITHSPNMLASIICAAADWAGNIRTLATQGPWEDPVDDFDEQNDNPPDDDRRRRRPPPY